MTEQKKTRSELKREAILTAARSAFMEFGAQATSMDKLAELAGVSKRTVYNHFENKEELIFELMREQWQKSLMALEFDYQASQPLEPQLISLLKQKITLIGNESLLEISRLAIGYFLYQPEALKKEVERMSEQETALKRWVNAAIADGRLAIDDPQYACDQVDHIVKGNCFWGQLLKCEETPSDEQQHHIASETARLFLSRYAT